MEALLEEYLARFTTHLQAHLQPFNMQLHCKKGYLRVI